MRREELFVMKITDCSFGGGGGAKNMKFLHSRRMVNCWPSRITVR